MCIAELIRIRLSRLCCDDGNVSLRSSSLFESFLQIVVPGKDNDDNNNMLSATDRLTVC